MIKKILFALLFVFSVSNAGFDENIINLIQKETKTKVKVIKSESLQDNKDLRFVVVEIVDNAQQIPLFASKDGNLVIGFSNVFFTTSANDEKIIATHSKAAMEHNENSQKIAAGKLIDELKPEQYITLKSSAKNPKTTFIVADPNCGYCKEEFRKIDERLKTSNVNMVMVGILGEDSMKKAAYITSKINSNSSEKDKMNTLKEVFSANFKAPKSIDTTNVEKTTEFLFGKGVLRGVPFIYEK